MIVLMLTLPGNSFFSSLPFLGSHFRLFEDCKSWLEKEKGHIVLEITPDCDTTHWGDIGKAMSKVMSPKSVPDAGINDVCSKGGSEKPAGVIVDVDETGDV